MDDRLTLFDRGHAKDVPLLVSFFRRRVVFNLLTAKLTEATEKFLEKNDPCVCARSGPVNKTS